jgi:hypothetical protein
VFLASAFGWELVRRFIPGGLEAAGWLVPCGLLLGGVVAHGISVWRDPGQSLLEQLTGTRIVRQ